MSKYPVALQRYVDSDVLEERDLHAAAAFIEVAQRSGEGEVPELVWLAVALALGAFRDQHMCIDLEYIAKWAEESDPNVWREALLACGYVVVEPSAAGVMPRRPFVLDGYLLYVHRSWAEECFVAAALSRGGAEHLTVLLGGPGSGKTTRVAKDLVELFSQAGDQPPLVALAAPTGKAAKRMTEALKERLDSENAPQRLRDAVNAAPASTIHSLLGASPNRVENRFTYNANNKLPHDIVIIDETSMLSMSMMFHLLEALRDEARIMLVGDPDQLASVDAGTVLADIALGAKNKGSVIAPRIELLTDQHRFAADSPIAGIASAIRMGNVEDTLEILSSKHPQLTWIDPSDNTEDIEELLELVVDHARAMGKLAADGEFIEAVQLRKEVQVLCALRNGQFGVAGWNRMVEQKLGMNAANQWYLGRPVLVSSNDRTTGLYNGDVGIVCANSDGSRVAAFSSTDEKFRFPVTRLPDVETVHALTIHKSQGSEYEHAIVVLPTHESRILTRELLYTGATRARTKLTIIATPEVISLSVKNPIRRATGLARRL
jgi:exodeoxyribonuclease V alpha subunit